MINHQIKTVLLLGALTAVLLVVGQFIGGMAGLTIAIIFAVGMNLVMYFFSHKIVLMMYRAKEAKKADYPKLHKIVEHLVKEAGLPKPAVYIVPTNNPNAFATGRDPAHAVVACTEGILTLLSDKELEGVLAHELAHVKNRDMLVTTIAATIAGIISYVAAMARFAAIFGGFGGSNDREGNMGSVLSLIVIGILTPIIALLLQLAISRSREYLADATGARISKNPHGLADALEKLEKGVKHHPLRFGSPATSSLFIANPFTSSGLFALLSTHPPMNERIKRLREMKV